MPRPNTAAVAAAYKRMGHVFSDRLRPQATSMHVLAPGAYILEVSEFLRTGQFMIALRLDV